MDVPIMDLFLSTSFASLVWLPPPLFFHGTLRQYGIQIQLYKHGTHRMLLLFLLLLKKGYRKRKIQTNNNKYRARVRKNEDYSSYKPTVREQYHAFHYSVKQQHNSVEYAIKLINTNKLMMSNSRRSYRPASFRLSKLSFRTKFKSYNVRQCFSAVQIVVIKVGGNARNTMKQLAVEFALHRVGCYRSQNNIDYD